MRLPKTVIGAIVAIIAALAFASMSPLNPFIYHMNTSAVVGGSLVGLTGLLMVLKGPLIILKIIGFAALIIGAVWLSTGV